MSDGLQDFASLILPSPTLATRGGERPPAGGAARDNISKFVQLLDTHAGALNIPVRAGLASAEHAETGADGNHRNRLDDAGPSLLSLVLQGLPGESPMAVAASGAIGSKPAGAAAAGLIEGHSAPLTPVAGRITAAGRHAAAHAAGRDDRLVGNATRIPETLLAHPGTGGEVRGKVNAPGGRDGRLAGKAARIPEALLAHPEPDGELRGLEVKDSSVGQAQRVLASGLSPADSSQAFRIPAGLHARLAANGHEVDGEAQRLIAEARSASPAGSGEARSFNEAPGAGLLGDDGLPPAVSSRLSPVAADQLPTMQRRVAAQTLDRILIMSRKGADHARLQLSPPELGRVDIKLDIDGNDTRVQLTVQNAIARESVEAMLPKLREALQQQGLELLDASVSEQHEDHGQGGLSDPDADPGSPDMHPSAGPDGGEAGNRATRAASIEGLVDAYA